MEWKKNNKTYQILTAAEKGGYGVVAPIAFVPLYLTPLPRMSLTHQNLGTILNAFSDAFVLPRPNAHL
jgi:hypothetical protein